LLCLLHEVRTAIEDEISQEKTLIHGMCFDWFEHEA